VSFRPPLAQFLTVFSRFSPNALFTSSHNLGPVYLFSEKATPFQLAFQWLSRLPNCSVTCASPAVMPLVDTLSLDSLCLASLPVFPPTSAVLGVFQSLGIAKDLASLPLPRRARYRGCRAGRSAKRVRAVSQSMQCGLLNARSVSSNAGIIAQHLLNFDLDLVAVTESWLTPDSGDDVLRGVCPEGYLSLHRPRLERRGGGLALIYRSTILPHIIDIPFISTAFESLVCSFSINSSAISLF
jgi:hypothetical protein